MAEAARERAIVEFLDRAGWGDAARRPLAGDASFRRYERLERAGRGGGRAVLMDAPPPQEDVRPFMAVADLIRRAGLSAPEILAADPRAGLLLIEDFGDDTYTRLLARGADERPLYDLAVDALIELHRNLSQEQIAGLPAFDDARCVEEAMRLIEWLWPAMHGAPPTATIRRSFESAWRQVLPAARRIPDGLMHYDYHVDNLMLLGGREGPAQVGLLDFQDAVMGPAAYDLASLLQDARVDVPELLEVELLGNYVKQRAAADPDFEPANFIRIYATVAAQRASKILGIFARLNRRDGKPQYLRHIPRVWGYLQRSLAHPSLVGLRDWYTEHVPVPQAAAQPAEPVEPVFDNAAAQLANQE